MSNLKVIITGATGMVGEGVLFECLQNKNVSEVLIISRRHYELQHPRLKELIVPDFLNLEKISSQISGYDACFFCAGISSVGMKEERFRQITYDTTMAFARALVAVNTNMVFTYVSGSYTDSSEQGKVMWARVKGKTENDLLKLPFKAVYNFRPGVMTPFDGQKNWKWFFKLMAKTIKAVAPKFVITLHQLGMAMINVTTKGYPKAILEVADIKTAAAS